MGQCVSDQIDRYRLRSTNKQTRPLTFNNQRKLCKVVDVYDGDTITVVFFYRNAPYLWKIRLAGIDTPELRTKCEMEKQHGYHVRDLLRKRILNKIIVLRCGGFDKYGRLLATPYQNKENLCEWMITHKYAVPYDGGTKKPWREILSGSQI